MSKEILTRVRENSKLWVPAVLLLITLFLVVLAAGGTFKLEYSHRASDSDSETQISVELQ